MESQTKSIKLTPFYVWKSRFHDVDESLYAELPLAEKWSRELQLEYHEKECLIMDDYDDVERDNKIRLLRKQQAFTAGVERQHDEDIKFPN